MGGCANENGYRGLLISLKKADSATLNKSFENIRNGEIKEVISALDKYPGLINQKSPTHGATLLISALYEIQHTASKPTRDNLISLVNYFIENSVKLKLDLTASDNQGNTALHRAFWLAVTSNHPDLTKLYFDMGVKFIKLVSGASEFRKIIGIKNNHGESFLSNIFTEIPGRTDKQSFEFVTKNIAPILDKFRVAQSSSAKTQYDFKNKSFKELLEESLLDIVTQEVIQNPYLLQTEGHSLGLETWKKLNPKRNPLTSHPFEDKELIKNVRLENILILFQKVDDDATLYKELQKYFSKQADLHDSYLLDITSANISELVNAYGKYLTPASDLKEIKVEKKESKSAGPGHDLKNQQAALATALQEVIADLIKRSGKKDKIDRLKAVHSWLMQQEPTEVNLGFCLDLSKSICAKKKGLFASKSLGELEKRIKSLNIASLNLVITEKDLTDISDAKSIEPLLNKKTEIFAKKKLT